MIRSFLSIFALLGLLLLASPVAAEAAPSPGEAGPPPAKPSALTPIADQLNQLINGNKTPAAATTTAAPAAAPATPAAATPAADATAIEEAVEQPISDTTGTRILKILLDVADIVANQATEFAENFADLPQVSQWYDHQLDSPVLRARWHDVGRDLLLIVAVAFGGAFIFELFLLPVRRDLRRRSPANFARRAAAAIALMLVEVLPVIFFVFAALTMLDQQETYRLPRFVVLNVIYALALNRLVMIVGNLLLSPRAASLRLLPISQGATSYLYRWLRFYSFVTVYGYFCVDVARSIRVPPTAVNAFGALLGLILVAMTIAVIMQKRAFVAVALRGPYSAARRDELTMTQNLRLWLARSWHVIAIAYLVIGYLVTALGVQGGLAIMLRGTVLSFLVFAAAFIAFSAIARIGHVRGQREDEPQLHHHILRFFLRFGVWITMIVGLVAAWGANLSAFLATPFGERLCFSLLWIGATVIILTLIYGYLNDGIERHLTGRSDKDGKPLPPTPRMRTLLPMVRNAVFILFSIIAVVVILSEAGANIGPLLAGAGVVGVAVGFGSQTLVKDFLTGLFIVIENTIAVGDVVKIGDKGGVVEAMTIRTIRLRDTDGALHIMPFGEISKFTNLTKDFSYALLKIDVAYNTDLRHAMEVIRTVGDALQEDPLFRYDITAPIEVMGVDSFNDYSITILARLRTRPLRQWDVRRTFLLRLKDRFDAENIEIPFPTATRIMREEQMAAAGPDMPKPAAAD